MLSLCMYIGYWYGYHMGFALGVKVNSLSTHRACPGMGVCGFFSWLKHLSVHALEPSSLLSETQAAENSF